MSQTLQNGNRHGRAKKLERITFATSRLMEFFSENELVMQIGHPRYAWALALLKELIDNSLDACEEGEVAPEVIVGIDDDSFTIVDNGPGIPSKTVLDSLDYTVRISSKARYVSPTRGALGNALKCVWAAPFVIHGEQGLAEIAAQGIRHIIKVSIDRLEGKPVIKHDQQQDAAVKIGTFLKVHWYELASYLEDEWPDSYNALYLLRAFATFNPHASFRLNGCVGHQTLAATNPSWQKWRPDRPTCPHWYTPETLRNLIAANLANEQAGGTARTVREFVAEFAGLRGTAKSKAVLAEAGLSGASLSNLVHDRDVDLQRVRVLLQSMQAAVRPVKSSALGTLGEEHLTDCLVRHFGADPESVRYKRAMLPEGEEGLPFVLEVAFGVKEQSRSHEPRDVVIGLNWSPSLHAPFDDLTELLGEMRIDDHDPVTVLVHLTCPKLGYTDRGKARLTLAPEVQEALGRCIRGVAKDWKKSKRRADREDRLSEQALERLRKGRRPKDDIKKAAYQVMEEAYLFTSDNGTLPANVRQVMYAARKRVLELTNGKCWKNSSYFTQKLLPEFMEAYPELTESWDVVFDSRGHLVEPHTGRRIDLGTLGVRKYMAEWAMNLTEEIRPPVLQPNCPTFGPVNRFKFALFVEKQGFDSLIERANIARLFDIALMSTKGMSVTAARRLVERLSEMGVTCLVLRDFDKSGFSIIHTLRSDTRRYRFTSPPKVIDIGLRLEDVLALGLDSERVHYASKKDPRVNLRERGATDAECDYLVRDEEGAGWLGERVELNAMSSAQFIQFLQGKLELHGVTKLIPNDETLEMAHRRATRLAAAQAAIVEVFENLPDVIGPMPRDLKDRVRAKIEKTGLSWDAALWQIVREGA